MLLFSRKMDNDFAFMHQALDEARAAAAAGEVPVGAVLVHGGKIIARSGNRTVRDGDPTAHAALDEMRGRMDRWMKRTDDPLLRGPVKAPAGAVVNDPNGMSPTLRN